ncbi:hypothetical protein [Rhodococcus sp. SMB37]|uniref:hypothetical protein n=1 Tax=Rhodococcus sp. SMB37 TaxID=2512213 RepID=UPI000AFE8BD4|nr:hypothetical protein [Rhodococcus sp. SMB37]
MRCTDRGTRDELWVFLLSAVGSMSVDSASTVVGAPTSDFRVLSRIVAIAQPSPIAAPDHRRRELLRGMGTPS